MLGLMDMCTLLWNGWLSPLGSLLYSRTKCIWPVFAPPHDQMNCVLNICIFGRTWSSYNKTFQIRSDGKACQLKQRVAAYILFAAAAAVVDVSEM